MDVKENLKERIGETFEKERHGQKTRVILEEIKRDTVVVGFEGRADKQTITLKEFTKFYRWVS